MYLYVITSFYTLRDIYFYRILRSFFNILRWSANNVFSNYPKMAKGQRKCYNSRSFSWPKTAVDAYCNSYILKANESME